MTTCCSDQSCDNHKPAPKPEPQEGTRVVLKNGQWLELDLSATQVKRLRRAKQVITTQGPDGMKYSLNCGRIKEIYPNEE